MKFTGEFEQFFRNLNMPSPAQLCNWCWSLSNEIPTCWELNSFTVGCWSKYPATALGLVVMAWLLNPLDTRMATNNITILTGSFLTFSSVLYSAVIYKNISFTFQLKTSLRLTLIPKLFIIARSFLSRFVVKSATFFLKKNKKIMGYNDNGTYVWGTTLGHVGFQSQLFSELIL